MSYTTKYIRKTKNRSTAIPISKINKHIIYYLENVPFDTPIEVANDGLYVGLLHNLFADKHRVIETDTETLNFDERFPEKLHLRVGAGYHITERSIIRFNRLIFDAFIENIVRISLPLHKCGISRAAVVETEIDRAGITELVCVESIKKACYKRVEKLGIAPYSMKDFNHIPMSTWQLKEKRPA